MERFASFVVRSRRPIFILMIVVTALFAWYAVQVRFRTAISDLWPASHPFIKVHQEYESQYGSPLTVYVMVKVMDGTIYEPRTLEKIARVTRLLDDIPGVNHDQVISIASRKVKRITLSGAEVHVENLFPHRVPSTPVELAAFRDAVNGAGVVGTLVSFDGTASLISANFLEERTDLEKVFQALLEIKRNETDANHTIYLAGQPVLLGWVRTYQREIVRNIVISMSLTVLLLYLYIRSWRLTILPAIATVSSALWGLGFAGLLGYTLDPLILLIPALLMARTLSHGIQKVERMIELSSENLDAQSGGRALILALFGSGTLGIITDVIGLMVIAISSIPVMERLAYFCSVWAASIIPSVLIFIPVVVAIFGLPRSWKVKERLEESWITSVLRINGAVTTGWRAKWVVGGFVVVTVFSFLMSLKVSVGDIHPGTSLLWPDSPFNVAAQNINENFAGTDELYVIARIPPTSGENGAGRAAAGGAAAATAENAGNGSQPSREIEELLGIRRVSVLERMQDFQRYVERHPGVRRTFSYADF